MESDKYLSDEWEHTLSATVAEYVPENVMVLLQPVVVIDPTPYLFFLLLVSVVAGCRCASLSSPPSPPSPPSPKKVCAV